MNDGDAQDPTDGRNGAPGEDDADSLEPSAGLEPSPDPRDAPAPPAVAELAAACVRFVATKYKVHLDFAPETLSLVDQYVRDAREDIAVKPEVIDLVQSSIGAYFGEVLRRAFGATWFCEGDHDGWRLDFSFVYLSLNPIGMMREALALEAQEGWHAHLETDPGETAFLEARLATLGSIDEEEYYAPTTRFDVVEIAVDTLRAKMDSEGNGNVTFGPEDYTR
jgi:hypothetical protein